ncbi:MAG: hypothetical protein P8Z81_04210 [Deinococcales bacterium]|jgi:predicted lipid-binding transport protein (Tim44 family)
MKRSFQEVVELVVFGLIALLIGTGLLWLVGWVLGLVGLLMKFLAGLIWWLLRYIVPIAIVAGLIYFLVRVLQGDRSGRAAPATAAPGGTGTAPVPAPSGAPADSDALSGGTGDGPDTAEATDEAEASGPPGDADAEAGASPEADEGSHEDAGGGEDKHN